MALDRTNMVSLLDMGTLMGGKSADIQEMGDGYKEITEDWGPDIDTIQYVNMKSKSSTLKGYDLSITPEREHIKDSMQTAINNLFKKFPTGDGCNTYYYRFYKTDITENSGECIRVPVIVAPSSTGGEGGGVLNSGIQIKGNGDVELGTITITKSGSGVSYEWTAKA